MNQFAILAFFYFVLLSFISGVGVLAIFGIQDKLMKQRSLFLGEALLLGNILIIGELVALSLTKFYHGYYLWIIVSFNMLFFLRSKTREYLGSFFNKGFSFDPAFIFFIFFFIMFSFRNCFPLMDNDSHSTYLWMPKLWLLHGTSIFKEVVDTRAHTPHMESVPYALGMVLFDKETLFQGFINLQWRWVVLLLVFGYTSYRLNTFYGLAAALFVMLNDHFFYSGINYSVLLNGAVIAFIFAAAYNFWESRTQESPFRFMLSILFLSQVVGTKANMAMVVIVLTVFMLLTQRRVFSQLKEIVIRRNWLVPLLIAISFTAFWFLRSYLVTGLATFPALAGKFYVLGWTPESDRVRWAIIGGIDLFRFLKYMNYLFIWPGIDAAKIVIVMISFLPLILLWGNIKNKIDKDALTELCFWLGVSLLVVMGIVLVCHQDPRYYRYAIGVLAFTAIYSVRFVLFHCMKIKIEWIIAGILFLMSLAPVRLILLHDTTDHHPTIQENWAVLTNQLRTDQVMDEFFPRNRWALKGYYENPDKIAKAAWGDISSPAATSNFILPERPHVGGFWYTAIVKWDSYESEERIAKDIRDYGVEWIMDVKGDEPKLRFRTPEEYAQEAVKLDRYPKRTYFNFGFPDELNRTNL